MKVLGLVGSPRKGGNTDTLVGRVLEGAKSKGAEVKKVYLGDLNIHPCQGAFSCEARKSCVLPDDMPPLYESLRRAHGVVIGTPVYVGNASGLLVNFLGRCRPFISFLDSAGSSGEEISPEQAAALRREKTCLLISRGTAYADLPSPAEEAMRRAIQAHLDRDPSSHPLPARRLPPGKKGVILLTYHQPGEEKYRSVADFLRFNLNLWGLEILDLIPAYRLLKKGDAQMRDDLMERAWRAGRMF